jgi:hypothetical protein
VTADGLAESVGELRTALDGIPDAVTFGDLPPGLQPGEGPADLPAALRALLEITDGPVCGSIVVFAAEDLPERQFYTGNVDGGERDWLCFATVADEPLLLRRDSGEVWYHPDTGTLYWMSDRFERLVPDASAFAERYLFGPGYRDLVPDPDDRWYELLHEHNLA